MKKNKIITSLFLLLLAVTASGQSHRLEKLEMVNMAGFYRMMIQCDSRAPFVHRTDSDGLGVTIYLRDAGMFLPKDAYIFNKGGVASARATQLRQFPHVVKIAIAFTQELEFEVHATGSTLNIDFKPPTVPVNGHSQNGESGRFDTAVPFSEDVTPGTQTAVSTSIRSDAPDSAMPLLNRPDRISLDVHDAEVSNVLRLLSKQTSLNIVASKDVKDTVTVSLTDVTIREALDMVTKANGLDYVVNGDIILVKPREMFDFPELETRVFRLKYVDAGNLQATLSKVVSAQAKVQVFFSNFQPQTQATPLEGAATQAKSKKRSSTLIVTDTRENLAQVEAMIEALDVPTPQIMIEAKLIEISPQNEQKLGINWSKSINAEIFREVLLPSGVPYRYSAEAPLEGGSINYGTLKFGDYNAVLDFLSTNTNSKLVSNPRILTMDNQEAIISVGTTVPIPQINRGIGGQGDVVTFQYRDVNIALKVTPHISEGDRITLYVNPEVEEIIGEVRAGDNSAPITSKRTVETVVHLRSNETMVVGGLIRENTIDTISKVWLLGDIPLIGNLFRHQEKTRRQTDLLIFITPRVIIEN